MPNSLRKEFRSRTILYNPLKYYEEEGNEEALDVLEDYENESVEKLITFHSNLDSRDDIPPEERSLRQRILRQLIHQKLKVVSHDQVNYFCDIIDDLLSLLDDRLEQLAKYENHRHKTVFGLYTEKPVY